MNLKRYEEALTAIDVAISSGPDHPINYHNRGLALEKLGRHEESRLAYRIYEESRNRK